MSPAYETGTVLAMRGLCYRLGRCLAAIAVAVTPASATLLAAPGAAPANPPIGIEAWRADPRRLPDPVTADPAAVQRFFAVLGPTEQRELAATYPGVVGNLDGAPIDLRYAANRLTSKRAEQMLLFDPRGDGEVAQVFGDLANARRVAILVPGAGNRAGNFWSGVGGKAFRSPARQGADLYRTAQGYGADHFAVVVWLGYDAPDGINVAAAREDLARAGAAALERFVAGLAAVRPQATFALLGHSYGSTVIGLAARHLPAAVTDLAAFGSPGMGVDTAAELGTTARVWAGLAKGDAMRFVPGVRLFGLGHGRQPADPAFGATLFPVRDVADHDHYLAAGTDSQASLARIALFGSEGRS
jgi:Alpha/beta hydrolase